MLYLIDPPALGGGVGKVKPIDVVQNELICVTQMTQMKKCLVIASTYREIEPFMKAYREDMSKWDDRLEIDVLVTGVGLTATTYSLARQVFLKRPDLVIQAGIAGSFDKRIKPGSVHIVSDDCIGDEMVIDGRKLFTVFDLGLRKKDHPPYRNEWLKNPHREVLKMTGLDSVKAISVNQVNTDKKTIRILRKKYKASLESMEGAALHLVCLCENIPFLQIRAVSNVVGERRKEKWKLGKSVSVLNKTLFEMLDRLAIQKQNP
jgi:futalosine hydrolase